MQRLLVISIMLTDDKLAHVADGLTLKRKRLVVASAMTAVVQDNAPYSPDAICMSLSLRALVA